MNKQASSIYVNQTCGKMKQKHRKNNKTEFINTKLTTDMSIIKTVQKRDLETVVGCNALVLPPAICFRYYNVIKCIWT